MRIEQLQIDGFGKWNHQKITLGPGLTILTGDNEAGKSTLVRFIESILFGFANGHQPYEQYLPKSNEGYGGALTIKQAGQRYVLRRVPGKNGGQLSIVTDNAHRVPDTLLDHWLGPIDQSLFETTFSFNERELNQIFVLTRGELEIQLQQMGASGSRHWLKVSETLQKQADELYKVRGRKPIINQKLAQYHTLDERIRRAESQYDRYHALNTQLASDKQQLNTLTLQIKQQEQKLHQLESLVRLWPTFEQLQETQVVKNSRMIPSEDVTKIQTFLTQETEINRQIETTSQQLNAVDATMTHSRANEFYEQNTDQLQRLLAEGTTLVKQMTQVKSTQASLPEWQAEQQRLIQRYGGQPLPTPLSSADEVRLQQLLVSAGDSRSGRYQTHGRPSQSFLGMVITGVGVGVGMLLWHNHLIFKMLGLGLIGVSLYLWMSQKGKRSRQSMGPTQSSNNQQLEDFGRQHGLANFDTVQWLPMQSDLRRLRELDQRVTQATRQNAIIDEKSIQFQQKAQFVREYVDLTGTLTQSVSQLQQFVMTQRARYDSYQQQHQRKQILSQQDAELRKELTDVQIKKQQLYTYYQIQSDEQFTRDYTQSLKVLENETRRTALSSQITDQQLVALRQVTSESALNQQIEALKQTINTNQQSSRQFQQAITRAEVEVQHLAADGTLTVLQQERANLETEIQELVQEWLSVQMGVRWIKRALQLASSNRLPKIIMSAKKYFEILTNHHYTDIRFDGQQLLVVSNEQLQFEVGELSLGTAEQLYVSLKLAVALTLGRQYDLPIIIDDGFVNFDQKRKQNVLQVLEELSKSQQVIYLTSDKKSIQSVTATVINLNEM